MKITVNKIILFSLALLCLGFFLGWVFFSSDSPHTEHSHSEVSNENEIWTCSMHPQIRLNEQGKCPICGMDLIPLEDEMSEGVDQMEVKMSPTAIQLAGITTAQIGGLNPKKQIRLNGKIQVDERMIFSQTPHIPGRIEKLMVNFTGEYVSKGKPIAYLYSPQLVTAQEELFEAYKIRENQPQLYKAAREKLKNWKLSESQIDEVVNSKQTKEAFPVNADHSGFVIEKKVNLGDHVMAGQSIYEIADLSRVWVLFDIYEIDLPWIKTGNQISFTISSLPGKTFEGKIDYIDPVINPNTRVAQARVVIQNKGQTLKPEMFATGIINAALEERENQLIIPKSAVLWTGKRSVVYVKTSSEKGLAFKMREVVLGPSLENAYAVESGLSAGEEIAVSGTFSIDAAAQLAGKPSMMDIDGDGITTTQNQKESSTQNVNLKQVENKNLPIISESNQFVNVDLAFKNQLQNVFLQYLPLKDALIDSDVTVANMVANELLKTINNVDKSLLNGKTQTAWMKDLILLESYSQEISNEEDIEKIRTQFSFLGDQLYHSLKKFQVQIDGYRLYCPMANNNQGLFWLSDSDKVLNPYFGDAMLTCGTVEEEL